MTSLKIHIIKWLNRITLLTFIVLIIIGGIFNPHYLAFSLMFTGCIGITQVVSALILSTQYIREKERKRVRIYIFTVLFYFTAIYVID